MRGRAQQSWLFSLVVASLLGCYGTILASPIQVTPLTSKCPSASPALSTALANCSVQGTVTSSDSAFYTFDIAAMPDFDVVVLLRSARGVANLSIHIANGSIIDSEPALPNYTGERILQLPRTMLKAQPKGYYGIMVNTKSMHATYTLKVEAVDVKVPLAQADRIQLQAIHTQCCAQPGLNPSTACTLLKTAVGPGSPAGSDICNFLPNQCDANGNLIRLHLPGAGMGTFGCTQPPAAFGNLSSLQVLEISHAGANWNISDFINIMLPSRVAKLYLSNNLFMGELDPQCTLIEKNKLQVLWLDNNRISGGVPQCYFSSATLSELLLAENMLSGFLPNVAALSPALTLLDVSSQSGSIGLGGAIPASFAESVTLQSLDLSFNALQGPIPAFSSASLQSLRLRGNALNGSIPDTLTKCSNLQVLSLAANALTGAVPDYLMSLPNLELLDLSANSLNGTLGGAQINAQAASLQLVDLSDNKFTGTVPSAFASLTDLVFLNLAGNQLTGNLEAFAKVLSMPTLATNSLLYLDVSGNILEGPLPAGLASMALFQPTETELPFPEDRAATAMLNTLNVANNQMHAEFPDWLIVAAAGTPSNPLNSSAIDIQLDDVEDDNKWACPTGETVTTLNPEIRQVLEPWRFECIDPSTQEAVMLVDWLSHPVNPVATQKMAPPMAEIISGQPVQAANPAESIESAHRSTSVTAQSTAPAVSKEAGSNKERKGLSTPILMGIILVVVVVAVVVGAVVGVRAHKRRMVNKGRRFSSFQDENLVAAAPPPLSLPHQV